jgi:hypothetical protein
LTIIVALGLWLSWSASAVAFQNEPTGFHGILWGTQFTAVQGQMKPSGYADGSYARVADDLTFGNMRLARINYFFRDGAFDGVVLVAKPNRLDGLLLLDTLRSSFGQATEGKDDVYIWIGSQSAIFVKCKRQECWAYISRAAANPGSQQQSDPVMAQYHQCMTHCTNMYITCNMGRSDVGEMSKPPSLRCDNQKSACYADCNAEFRKLNR